MLSENKPSSNQPKDEDFTKDYQKKKKRERGHITPPPPQQTKGLPIKEKKKTQVLYYL